MSYTLRVSPSKSLSIAGLSVLFLLGLSVGYAAEETSAFENRVQSIGELIQQKDISHATALDQFWSEHHSEKGFVDAVRRIKDCYWTAGYYAEHFALCERIVQAFPTDPLSMGIQVDIVTGYIKLKNLAKASEKLESFWVQCHSDKRFVEYVRWIKDAYWQTGEHAAHYAVCERIIKDFPDHPLTVATCADEINGYIEDKELVKASEKLEMFWATQKSKEGFVEAARRIKDHYWINGEHAGHFAVCDRIIREFPDHPLTVPTCADEINGYIEDKELVKASEKLEQFWATQKSKEGFVEAARRIKDHYWINGGHAGHFAVCDRIIREFPDHPMTVTTRADEIVGYIEDKDLAKASEKLERFWAHDHSDERFAEYAYKIKSAYWLAGDYAAHFAVCERIIREFPDHPLAVTTCGDAIAGYLLENDMSTAEAGIEILFSRYTAPVDAFLTSIAHIQESCRRISDHSLAIDIGSRALKINSSHENAFWVYQNLIYSYLNLNAVEQADVLYGVVLEKYPTHPDWVRFLNGLADHYRQAKHYLRSMELFQAVLARNPETDQQLDAYAGIAKVRIRLSSDTATLADISEINAIVNNIVSKYKECGNAGLHGIQIGEEYYFLGKEALEKAMNEKAGEHFSRAIAIWNQVINSEVHLGSRGECYYLMGMCYYENGEYADAANAFKMVYQVEPSYTYADYCVFAAADCYDRLMQNDVIPSSEAKTLIRVQFEQLVEQFPNSAYASNAKAYLELN